jgi:uncharacterized membrane protein YeiH
MTTEYFHFLGILGVAFFAVSGTLLGHEKKINGFGVVVVASLTALGGGTIRDVILSQPIFWINSPDYLLSTYAAIIGTILFIRYMPPLSNYYFIFVDAVGLAIFNIMGIEKALIEGTGMIIAITMGMTTGIFGGLMRDVVCREIPLVMQGDVYASACLAGGLTYAALFSLDAPYAWCILGSVIVTVVLRAGATRWGWQVNLFKKRRSVPREKE